MTVNENDLEAKTELGEAHFVTSSETVEVNPTTPIIGLTKEQLEEYRVNPTFRFLRYSLFLIFWLTWIGLFAAAILLVVLSPRKHASSKWAHSTSAYEIFVPTFYDGDGDGIGDFAGIAEKISYLKELNVDSVLLSPVFSTDKNSFHPLEVNRFDIDERFGNKPDFEDMVSKLAHNDINVIVDVPFNINSEAINSRIATGINKTILDISSETGHQVILKAVVYMEALGVKGAYLHDVNAPNSPTDYFKQLTQELRSILKPDFAIFVDEPGHNGTVYLKRLASSEQILEELVSANSYIQAQFGNSSIAPVIGSTYSSRLDQALQNFSISLDQKFQYIHLGTILKLLVGPVAHTFYGEEIGLLSTEGRRQFSQLGLMHWDSAADYHNGFTSFAQDLFFDDSFLAPNWQIALENYKTVADIRSMLNPDQIIVHDSRSIIRVTDYGLHYAIFYNPYSHSTNLPWKQYVPENLHAYLSKVVVVIGDATGGDWSDLSHEITPYGYLVVKLELAHS